MSAWVRRSTRRQAEPARLAEEDWDPGRQADMSLFLVGSNDWHSLEGRAGARIDLVNLLDDESLPPVAPPAAPSTPRRWLLPATDRVALRIARQRRALEAAGWTLLSSSPALVESLNNKALLQKHAAELRLGHLLPRHYFAAAAASYPSVFKPACGEHGEGVAIVRSGEEAEALIAEGGGRGGWVLQELVRGRREVSLSLLLREGEVVTGVRTVYVYEEAEYVWPRVREEVAQRTSEPVSSSDAEVVVLAKLLAGYTGVCNLNYKRRPDGSPVVFEVNARIGADLACDVPPPLLRAFLLAVDQGVALARAGGAAGHMDGAAAPLESDDDSDDDLPLVRRRAPEKRAAEAGLAHGPGWRRDARGKEEGRTADTAAEEPAEGDSWREGDRSEGDRSDDDDGEDDLQDDLPLAKRRRPAAPPAAVRRCAPRRSSHFRRS